jgi:predicted dienelactone hydrolase
MFCFAMILIGGVASAVVATGATYDPLAISKDQLPEPIDTAVQDKSRSREIPLRIYLPVQESPAPVVLFSHGLGGTRQGNAYCGKHWAARGYVVVFLQHAGSDDSVWRKKPLGERMAAMQRAANLENFMLRAKDVPVVLDQLQKWNEAADHALKGRLDMKNIGMSGHSFGAVTTQAVSGQTFPLAGNSLTDKRIKAAIAFSPSGGRGGADPKTTFADVKIPWLVMTGTKDTSPIGGVDLKSRLSVFPALPPEHKYELVLENAEHSAFTDRALPGDKEKRNPNHHRLILALSTAFWDTYLRDDAAAKAWLDGDGPQKLLENGDKWQKK